MGDGAEATDERIICTACNTENARDSRFCIACGKPIESDEGSSSHQQGVGACDNVVGREKPGEGRIVLLFVEALFGVEKELLGFLFLCTGGLVESSARRGYIRAEGRTRRHETKRPSKSLN